MARQPPPRSPSPLHHTVSSAAGYLLSPVPSPYFLAEISHRTQGSQSAASAHTQGRGQKLDKLVGWEILSRRGKGNTAWLGFGLATFHL